MIAATIISIMLIGLAAAIAKITLVAYDNRAMNRKYSGDSLAMWLGGLALTLFFSVLLIMVAGWQHDQKLAEGPARTSCEVVEVRHG